MDYIQRPLNIYGSQRLKTGSAKAKTRGETIPHFKCLGDSLLLFGRQFTVHLALFTGVVNTFTYLNTVIQ